MSEKFSSGTKKPHTNKQQTNELKDDCLIDWIEFYAVSAISQPRNDGMKDDDDGG